MIVATGWGEEIRINEETVKNRILVPYLQALGFSLDETRFEDRVTVRVWRTIHELRPVEGRLDIFVQPGERNLILVEVKAEGLKTSA